MDSGQREGVRSQPFAASVRFSRPRWFWLRTAGAMERFAGDRGLEWLRWGDIRASSVHNDVWPYVGAEIARGDQGIRASGRSRREPSSGRHSRILDDGRGGADRRPQPDRRQRLALRWLKCTAPDSSLVDYPVALELGEALGVTPRVVAIALNLRDGCRSGSGDETVCTSSAS